MVSPADFKRLPRVKMQKLVRLVAEFEDLRLGETFARIAVETGTKQVTNLSRDALPDEFREEIFKLFERLTLTQQAAITEAVMPNKLKQSHSLPTGLNQVFNESFFSKTLPYEIRNWPTPEYLILRLDRALDGSDDEVVRLSHMQFTFDPEGLSLPRYLTRRIKRDGRQKRVSGVLYSNAQELYAVGRLDGNGGLRFSRLRMISSFRDDQPQLDLYGVRLGRDEETSRPYAHIMYAYQIDSGAWPGLEKQRLGSTAVPITDEVIQTLIPEQDARDRIIDALWGSVHHTIPGGALPRATD